MTCACHPEEKEVKRPPLMYGYPLYVTIYDSYKPRRVLVVGVDYLGTPIDAHGEPVYQCGNIGPSPTIGDKP